MIIERLRQPLIRVGDRDQVVSVGAYGVAAHDPETAKEIWRVSYADGLSNVPRPVFGHGLVHIATGFQQPLLLRGPRGWDGRRDQIAHRVDAAQERAAHAVAAPARTPMPASSVNVTIVLTPAGRRQWPMHSPPRH